MVNDKIRQGVVKSMICTVYVHLLLSTTDLFLWSTFTTCLARFPSAHPLPTVCSRAVGSRHSAVPRRGRARARSTDTLIVVSALGSDRRCLLALGTGNPGRSQIFCDAGGLRARAAVRRRNSGDFVRGLGAHRLVRQAGDLGGGGGDARGLEYGNGLADG